MIWIFQHLTTQWSCGVYLWVRMHGIRHIWGLGTKKQARRGKIALVGRVPTRNIVTKYANNCYGLPEGIRWLKKHGTDPLRTHIKILKLVTNLNKSNSNKKRGRTAERARQTSRTMPAGNTTNRRWIGGIGDVCHKENQWNKTYNIEQSIPCTNYLSHTERAPPNTQKQQNSKTTKHSSKMQRNSEYNVVPKDSIKVQKKPSKVLTLTYHTQQPKTPPQEGRGCEKRTRRTKQCPSGQACQPTPNRQHTQNSNGFLFKNYPGTNQNVGCAPGDQSEITFRCT